jgi:hypothetical protein
MLDKVDRATVAEVQKLHVGAQVYRFLRVAAFAFLASLPLGTSNLGWQALAAVGAGALETAFRQLYPSFPLDKATSVVTQAVKEQATALATAAINARVEDYRVGLAAQTAVTTMLAQAGKTAQAVAASEPQPVHAAEPPTAAPVAKPPATS